MGLWKVFTHEICRFLPVAKWTSKFYEFELLIKAFQQNPNNSNIVRPIFALNLKLMNLYKCVAMRKKLVESNKYEMNCIKVSNSQLFEF